MLILEPYYFNTIEHYVPKFKDKIKVKAMPNTMDEIPTLKTMTSDKGFRHRIQIVLHSSQFH